MIKDAVLELIKSYFSDDLWKQFTITIHDYKEVGFGLTSNNNKLLLSFLLIRQREENGLTIRDVAKRGFNELSIPAIRMKKSGKSPVKITAGFMKKECSALLKEWDALPRKRLY